MDVQAVQLMFCFLVKQQKNSGTISGILSLELAPQCGSYIKSVSIDTGHQSMFLN